MANSISIIELIHIKIHGAASMSRNILIPSELSNRQENVSFSYRKNGNKTATDAENVACYATCMSYLPDCEFLLRPLKDRKSPLDHEIFVKFFELCKENRITVPDFEIRKEENKNMLFIPASGYSKHLVYATLCCYRWSENQPGLVYAVVKSMESYKDINFFQALHYGCLRRAIHQGHSFFPIWVSTIDPEKYVKNIYNCSAYKSAFSLSSSIAIKRVFFDNYESLKTNKTNGYTYDLVRSEIPRIGIENDYYIENTADFLDSRLNVLYSDNTNAKDIIKEINGSEKIN